VKANFGPVIAPSRADLGSVLSSARAWLNWLSRGARPSGSKHTHATHSPHWFVGPKRQASSTNRETTGAAPRDGAGKIRTNSDGFLGPSWNTPTEDRCRRGRVLMLLLCSGDGLGIKPVEASAPYLAHREPQIRCVSLSPAHPFTPVLWSGESQCRRVLPIMVPRVARCWLGASQFLIGASRRSESVPPRELCPEPINPL